MSRKIQTYGLALVAGLALFLLLGQRGLNEPDEGRYAEIAREMGDGGDWLVPHLNGFAHFQKPPVLYWITAASFNIFGYGEWAVRLPSALAALGTAGLTALLSLKLRQRGDGSMDRDHAQKAAVILISTGGFFALSRLLTPDMTMTFFITAAITAALYRRRWLFFVFMGLGFLTKGPVALVVPLCAVAGWELWAEPARKLRLPWWRGMILTLGISLSWFVVLSLKETALFEYFWRYELVERVASKAHGRSRPWWFFLVVLPAGLLPWVFFLPFRQTWRTIRMKRFQAWHGLLLGWVFPPLVVLSLSGSKLPTYVLPLLPAFALLLAEVLPSLRQVGKIAVPSLLLYLAGDRLVATWNDKLGLQASTRSLAAAVPGGAPAILFTCEVRTHGFEFYLRQIVNATQTTSDIVIPHTKKEQIKRYPERLYRNAEDCARRLTGGPPAYGVVIRSVFEKTFLPAGPWHVVATAGEILLITNQVPETPPR